MPAIHPMRAHIAVLTVPVADRKARHLHLVALSALLEGDFPVPKVFHVCGMMMPLPYGDRVK
jgi:aminoglycoside phosphotransferase (APT) family kinase protein